LLDPVLVGLIANHKILYLARKSLFRNRFFGAFLRYNGVIPLDREGGGLAGLRQTLGAIQAGQSVLMFPEGTRTPDGSLQDVKPGFLVLARRAGVPVVPLAIVGAYDVLPRGRSAPGWHPVAMVVGKPLVPSVFQKGSDGESIARLQGALTECDHRARNLCGWKCCPEAIGTAHPRSGHSGA
jgi:1-acyl-sn-glycerol-3-phosphate acyltransferase